jgi:hypothetical protein
MKIELIRSAGCTCVPPQLLGHGENVDSTSSGCIVFLLQRLYLKEHDYKIILPPPLPCLSRAELSGRFPFAYLQNNGSFNFN